MTCGVAVHQKILSGGKNDGITSSWKQGTDCAPQSLARQFDEFSSRDLASPHKLFLDSQGEEAVLS